MKLFIIFLNSLLMSTTAFAQPDSLWSRTYGGAGNDVCNAMQQTSDGGYILAGYTDSFGSGLADFWLVKTNANGDSLWSRTFGGDGSDVCRAVQETTDGGYILAGYTNSFGAGLNDMWLVKTDVNGDSLWSRTFGDSLDDEATAVRQTADGGYVVAGNQSWQWGGPYDMWLLKTDADGDSVWSRRYRGEDQVGYYLCNAMQPTSDGGCVLAGSRLVKTDANGDTLWTHPYFQNAWFARLAYAVVQTVDHGYLTGGTAYGQEGYSAGWLEKRDANGDSVWFRNYGGTAHDVCYDIEQTDDGGCVLGGYTYPGEGWNYLDMWIVKTDANGDSLWSLSFGGSGFDFARVVIQTRDGGYALAGSAEYFGAGGSDMWLVKLGPDVLPAPTGLVVYFTNGELTLRWDGDSNPYYRIYSNDDPDMSSPTYEGSTSDTSFIITGLSAKRFYYVIGSTEP